MTTNVASVQRDFDHAIESVCRGLVVWQSS